MKVMKRRSKETLTSCMDEMTQTREHLEPLSHAMCARSKCDNTRLRRLTITRTFTCSPSVSRHCRVYVLCVDLVFHVVIGVGRLTVQQEGFIRQLHFTTHTQFQVQSSFLLDVVVRLCPVIVNSNCIPNSCIFHIAKTGPLRCCLYTSRGR